MKELVTNITELESNEIECLFEKRKSLDSLMSTLNENEEYSKIKSEFSCRIDNDCSEIELGIKMWWEKTIMKYKLKKMEGTTYAVSYLDKAIYKIDECKTCCKD